MKLQEFVKRRIVKVQFIPIPMVRLVNTAQWHTRRKLAFCICIIRWLIHLVTSLGETLCLMCLQAPKMTLSHFCSQTCIDKVEKMGPVILEVPASHTTFKSGRFFPCIDSAAGINHWSVADQFKTSWRHNTQCPPVRRVYKICCPASSLAVYNSYR